MPRRGTDYQTYRGLFDKQYSKLKLPVDCKEVFAPTFSKATSVSWHLRWYLEFNDDKYVRIWEHFIRWPGLVGLAKRQSLAYHYGKIVKRTDDGLPGYLASDPVDIRIDNSCGPIHLHFNAQNPHHPKSSIEGLDLDDMEIFAFVNGIFKHRSTNTPLDKVFKFRIR